MKPRSINAIAWMVFGIASLLAMRPALAGTEWIQLLTDQALRTGSEAQLPPHLSLVLGLAVQGQSTPVRQLVVRAKGQIRVFNVCSSNHRKLVVFAVNEPTKTTTAYLFSAGGKLSSAVSYTAGGPAEAMSPPAGRAGFRHEVAYWSSRAAP